MYSVHGSGVVISFMDSLTICSTMALNLGPTETSHDSDIAMYHKSLCLHCDTDVAHISLCSKQVCFLMIPTPFTVNMNYNHALVLLTDSFI